MRKVEFCIKTDSVIRITQGAILGHIYKFTYNILNHLLIKKPKLIEVISEA